MGWLRRILYKNRKYYDDDFDWDNYTQDSYERRITTDIEPNFRTLSERGHLQFDKAAGSVISKEAPLHPNHQTILEAIGQLDVESVHEVGCGGGDHVANAQLLFPDIHVSGSDRGKTQLELACRRHPGMADRFSLQDITMPLSKAWPRADLIYSQAVLMHIHTAVSHFVGLANMVALSRRYVLLMENLQCHNFVSDLRALHQGGHLAWDDLHIHCFDGSTGARAILLSKTPLDLPVLTSDAECRAGVQPSARRLKRSDDDSGRGTFGFQTPGKATAGPVQSASAPAPKEP